MQLHKDKPDSHYLDLTLVSLKTLSDRWSCSRATVRRRLRAAGIKAYYIGGPGNNATLRYAEADVEEYLQKIREQ